MHDDKSCQSTLYYDKNCQDTQFVHMRPVKPAMTKLSHMQLTKPAMLQSNYKKKDQVKQVSLCYDKDCYDRSSRSHKSAQGHKYRQENVKEN